MLVTKKEIRKIEIEIKKKDNILKVSQMEH